ncbi:MAG: NAD-binding protein [Proteobacteria bacterium]|nr:NAD-binding protein [Pseudomonadota bacterium]
MKSPVTALVFLFAANAHAAPGLTFEYVEPDAPIEIDALLAAGIDEADIFIAATRGDNTNILVAQLAQKRFDVPRVIVRVLDPARSDWYAEQGLHTICAVKLGIAMFEQAVTEAAAEL